MIARGWVTLRQGMDHANMSEKREDNAPPLGGETALHHLALSPGRDDWQTRRQAAYELQGLGTGATTLLVEPLAAVKRWRRDQNRPPG